MARQKLGQHFLVRGSVLERIAAAACGAHAPLVVEIGPGRGALTARLLERAGRVVAIEVDPYLAAHLREKFAGRPNFEVVCADVLKTDLGQWGPAAIAGNLPYYITSPIIEKLLALGPLARRCTVLVQKEVAERLVAQPGHREYGYLTVHTALFAETKLLFEVKPAAFYPPPKVDSAVVLMEPRDRAAELGFTDVNGFLEFARLCFHQKRKTLRNNLAAVYGREAVENWPEASLRAEQVPLQTFAEMYRRLVR